MWELCCSFSVHLYYCSCVFIFVLQELSSSKKKSLYHLKENCCRCSWRIVYEERNPLRLSDPWSMHVWARLLKDIHGRGRAIIPEESVAVKIAISATSTMKPLGKRILVVKEEREAITWRQWIDATVAEVPAHRPIEILWNFVWLRGIEACSEFFVKNKFFIVVWRLNICRIIVWCVFVKRRSFWRIDCWIHSFTRVLSYKTVEIYSSGLFHIWKYGLFHIWKYFNKVV